MAIRFASGRSISKNALFHALNLCGWGLLVLVTASWQGAMWGLLPAALMDLIYGIGGIGVSLLLRIVFHRARRARLSFFKIAVIAGLASALLAVVWFPLDLFLDRHLFALVAREVSPNEGFVRLHAVFDQYTYIVTPESWLVTFLTLFTWSTLYLGINSVLDLEFERERTAQAIKLADSARLRALQSQLKPHFLFNTLNGISTLIREGQGAAAASMLSTLSDFLRLTLETKDLPEIAVADEIKFIERYLRIQKMRFGERLRTNIKVEAEALSARIPTLILQPLVENAVRHAILVREQGGRLELTIRRSGEQLIACVEDDGPNRPVQPLTYGVGLRNTADRLSALYADRGELRIETSSLGGFRVTLCMPYLADIASEPSHVWASKTA